MKPAALASCGLQPERFRVAACIHGFWSRKPVVFLLPSKQTFSPQVLHWPPRLAREPHCSQHGKRSGPSRLDRRGGSPRRMVRRLLLHRRTIHQHGRCDSLDKLFKKLAALVAACVLIVKLRRFSAHPFEGVVRATFLSLFIFVTLLTDRYTC